MKTKHIKISNLTVRQLPSILAASITGLLPALVLILTIESSFAESATWKTSPVDGDWNFVDDETDETNWTGDAVPPNGSADTATFATSSITDVFLSADTEVNGIVFNPGADEFTITASSGFTLTISGVGITNNSGITQNFVIDNDFEGSFGVITFTNSATAGNLTAFTNNGQIFFQDSATAGEATITNSGVGSVTQFGDNSTAANAVITNSGAASVTEFFNSSTAGNATITNSGANSRIDFFGSSSGADAALINANGTAVIDISGLTLPGMTVGSIAGNGSLFLGNKNLTVGGNQTSTVFSGVIQDGGGSGGTGGSLTKVGTGVLTLTGVNMYTGATTVNGGSLIVDSSISSEQTLVNAGGLLGGHGTLGGSLTNGGIVSPGNSPGTLHVSGDYTQNANGTLRIEVAGTAPGQFDLLAVGGHASLAGTLQLKRLGNFQLQVGDKLTFLTAGEGVSGTFSTVQNPFLSNTLVIAQINILANAVQLEGTQGSFTEAACSPNTLAVAEALDSAVGDSRAASLIEFLDSEPLTELCPDLDLISPEELASIFNIGVSLANIQTVNLERRMDDIRAGSSGFSARGFTINGRTPDFSPGLAGPTGPDGKSGPSVMQSTPENRWGVFVTGLGEFTNVGDTSNAHGFDLTTGGLTLGVDYRVGSNFAIGLTGGYAHTNADLANNGNLEVDGGKIGLYATAFSGGFYVDAAVTGDFNDYNIDRTALLGIAHGSTNGPEFTALLTSGYDWKIGGLSIGPVANFQYTYVDFDGFTENGSLAPLKFNSQDANSIRTSVGLKTSYDWKVGGVLVRPELRAAWQHEFGDSEYSIVSRFANGAGNSFTVNGPQIGRDSLLIGAGAAVLLNDRVSIYAYYDGELARTNYISNNVSAGLRVTF